MLADVIPYLLCPVCQGDLALAGGVVRCGQGHAYDVAKQGYVSLLTGSAAPGTADTPAMVAARAAFLGAGHFAPLARQLRELLHAAPVLASAGDTERHGTMVARGTGAPEQGGSAAGGRGPAVILDAGAGTGHYLAEVLGPADTGIALDISKHALKRAARAHPRIGAVVADVWRPLPVRDACADVLLNVFAPRNGPEFARVLRPGGTLIVVTPTPRHLSPLVGELGLLSVDEDKARRIAESLGTHFTEAGEHEVTAEMRLDHRAVETVAGMGPSAWHTDAEALGREILRLPDPVTVQMSCRVSLFRKIA
ncbi:SAM-dependent methyltransferase [Sphaerisporangium melleum]|uniref:SAM-dependent methyltransferase n=1 Tax=Sphaerisporangium melleum TaxID=321316 RepID=A0A917RE21_9ACTN|nr:methyltransferase domain-containing protein [Sphaerisporangium melleum]GGL03547.1 SAM-dependent methyltransferase [Sphaerisporangium melleum]GII74048.1 SAM-dependent methyltransferase [Sphaerisporangium melleum]